MGSVRVEEKGDPTRGQYSVIDIVRPWAKSRRRECHMGLCDSAPGTVDYPAKALDAVFGYGAVVAAPCCRLVSSDMSMYWHIRTHVFGFEIALIRWRALTYQ